MDRSKFALLAAAAGLAFATPANAAVTFTFAGGTGGLAAGETLLADFDTTNGGVIGGAVVQGDLSGQYAEPAYGDQGDKYLNVVGGDSALFDLTGYAGGGVGSISFDLGSVDRYNDFTVCLASSICTTYAGFTVVPGADGDQSDPATNGRLTFNATGGDIITSFTLASSANSLETDNFGITAAVPEPATWGMMLLGFGLMGASMRRRRSSVTLAQAV